MNFIVEIIHELPFSTKTADERFKRRQAVLFETNRRVLMSLVASAKQRTIRLSGAKVLLTTYFSEVELDRRKQILLKDSIASWVTSITPGSQFDSLRVGFLPFYEHTLMWTIDYLYKGKKVELLHVPYAEVAEVCFKITLTEILESK
ncbi:hypothetical protein VCRA2117O37_10179 [Vibrio crassostreae]|nr:hypothetical protein VCHA42O253_40110 [Vibrio chagasii]CAK1862005.1 hypothetical protein VCRA2117O37_10179 [Vibrio crassostreae]CAK1862475.1 hypothetical protein VCRA2116O31_10178 [Vibrio crassostreae]CAK2311345.1 hypothetical protein VCRA2119O51_10178 [Vibrio crassostreae]CAK2673521.1 hypothetical protein VCRA2113O25_10336 [Vibrio crassostreae]